MSYTYPPKSFRERRHGAIEQKNKQKKLACPQAKKEKKRTP